MGTSLTGNNISQSYLGLLKSTDSQALGSTAKRLTDGAGNDTPLYLSTSRLGIGVASPGRVLDVDGDIEVNSIRVGKGGGSISTNTVLGQNCINNSSNSGAGNVAIGFGTMIANTSGNFNVGIGLTSLKSNTTGDKNIAIGSDSLEANQTGSFNTAIGNETLKELSSGGHNIAIGSDAGNGIQTGSQSIIIGSQADASDVTSQNEIVIGYNLSGNGSNTVTIGNSSITTNYFNGNILLGNSSKLIFGTSDVYISGTTVSDNIQLGVGGSTQFTFAQTTGLRLHQYGSGSITGTVTQRLGVTSTGQVVEIPIGAGALDGSGTAGKIAKFTDSDTLGNSIMSETTDLITVEGGVLGRDIIRIFKAGQSSEKTYSALAGLQLFAQQSDTGSPFMKTSDIVANADGTVPSELRLFTKANGDSTPSERIRLTSTGLLGINLINPAGHLHVAGNTGGAGQIYISDADNGVGAGDSLLLSKSGVHGIIENRDSGDLRMGTNDDNTFLVIKPSGNVAIGSTTANAKLHISGISQTGTVNVFKIDNDTSNTKFAIDSVTGNYKLQFKNSTNAIRVLLNSSGDSYLTGGNVGISTDTPVSLLDLSNGNTQGDGISFGSNATEIRRGNSGANLQMSHFGNISMIIDSDNNDSSRFFNVMHGNNDSASATELFRVQETGEVLIGTTSASSIFTLGYDDATTLTNNSASGISIRNTNNTSGSGATITFEHTDSNSTGVVAKIGAINNPSTTDDNGILTFATRKIGVGMVRHMTINENGFVGIGTISPTNGKLQIDNSTNQISIETGTAGDGRLHIGHFANGTFIGTYGDDGGVADLLRFGVHSGDTALTINSDLSATFSGVGIFNDSARVANNKYFEGTHSNGTTALRMIGIDNSGDMFMGGIDGNVGNVTIRDGSGNNTIVLASNNASFAGKIGIGGTPLEDLHITGDTPVIRFTDSDTSRDAQIVSIDGNLRFDTDNNAQQAGTNISFRTDGVQRMAIESGVVTVNQADPDAPLQVRQTRDTNGNIRTNGTYAFIAEGNDSGAVGEGIGIHLTGKRTNGSATRGVSLLSLIQNTGNAHDLVIATSDTSAAPAERARVTDVGDFIVGKSTIAVTSTGFEARASGLLVATRNAGTAGIFNREGTTKGNIVDIRQDNLPVLTLGTTGDNVFVSGTANANDLLLRTNAQNRIRILDYGVTKFDTYGLVTTTPDGRMHQHQIFTMSCTSATSTTAKAMANVGTTNAFDYTIIAKIDATNIGSIAGRTATANGTNSGFFSRSAFNGNVTAITPTYNASSDTLDVAVTYSGSTAPTVSITINGISDVDISRTGGCSP